jgi:hypothetical protein
MGGVNVGGGGMDDIDRDGAMRNWNSAPTTQL